MVDTGENASMQQAENSFRSIDGKYEVGGPWKEDSHGMVKNHKMAIKRLQTSG